MRILLCVVWLVFYMGATAEAQAKETQETQLCGPIYWKSKPIDIDDFHMRMICGDPKSPQWEKVPLYQAKIHLEAFLQSRGYANAVIDLSETRLLVDRGPLLRLKRSETSPPDKVVNYELRRYERKAATPTLLSQLEGEAKGEYRNQGFPCAAVSSSIDITMGVATLLSETGAKRRFGPIDIEQHKEFPGPLLRRYYSFKETDEFRQDDLNLTRQRIDESEVVSGSYFVTTCSEQSTAEGASYLQHKYVLGLPRTFRFGLGADTEAGPYVYASWKNTRFTSHLGQLSVNASASWERQSLSADGSFYPSLVTPRFYYAFKPIVTRDISTGAEELSASIGFTPGQTWDTADELIRLEGGPYFIRTWHRLDGEDSFRNTFSVALKLDLSLLSHAYELTKGHPRGGYDFSIKTEFRGPAFGFFTNIFRAETQLKKVWKLGYCGPAECFLAFRQNTQLNFVNRDVAIERIPPSLQTFLGDARNLRGFALENALNPGLTQVTAGMDLRILPFLSQSFEPYLLADVGRLGKRSWSLEPDLLYAYGLGLRWFSPIGIVNGFVARAVTVNSSLPSEWYFFFGLGDGF